MGRSGLAQRATIVAVVAAVGAGGMLHTGALDPAVAFAAERVAERLPGHEPEAPVEDPARIERVSSWQWDDTPSWGSNSWSAAPPVKAGTRYKQDQFDPIEPIAAARPSSPELPVGTPLDGSFPWRLMQYSVNPKIEMSPMRNCPRQHGPGVNVPVEVEVSAGRATLTWDDLGDPRTTKYNIGAVPVSGERAGTSVRWTTATAPGTCAGGSATVTGLVSGESYQFYLEAVNTSKMRAGGLSLRTRGRSGTVEIP